MILRGVPKYSVELIARRAEFNALLATLDLKVMTLDDLWDFVREGKLQLWVLENEKNLQGLLLTEIIQHARVSVLLLRFGAGKFSREGVRLVREVVFSWAKTYGCTQVEVFGRKGWGKVLGLPEQTVVCRGEI